MSLFTSLIQSRDRHAEAAEANLGQSIKPRYELVDSKDAFALTVYLPGVNRESLQITAENNALRFLGRPAWKQPEGWTTLYNEFVERPFELAFEHDNSIDVEKIRAEIRDGVLRVSIPKAEELKPRRIAVN